MTYNSKKSIVSMAAGILLMAAYIIYAFGSHAPAPDDVKAWAISSGASPVIALHVLFGSVALGTLIGGGASIYYHEWGV